MNLLVIDPSACGLDLCLRSQKAGHQVRWWIKPKEPSRVGEGLVELVEDWEPSMDWADLVVIADNVKAMRALDSYRRRGYPILGPTWAGAELELDREKGQDLLRSCGVPTIKSEVFTDYDKAEALVRRTRKRYVSKPSGDADKALSYVSKSAADMIFMLQRWKANGKLKKAPFLLQEFVPGVEVAVGGWLSASGFSRWWCENFEHKKLMVDDLGPNTGEMGTVLAYTDESKLADLLLKPCEQALMDLGITGYVDVAAIVDKVGKAWPLEWTVRPGWPTDNIQYWLHKGDELDWMLGLVDGDDRLEVSDQIALGVVLAIPDFPYSQLTGKELEGYPLYGVEGVSKLSLCEVMRGKAPDDELKDVSMMVSAGDYILVSSGTGDTVAEAKAEAYKGIESVEMPNSAFYRTDIGDRVAKDLATLQKHGYCSSWRT